MKTQLLFILGVFGLTVPGLALRFTSAHPDPALAALAYGLAIVGAAFLLAWGAEVAQHDVPRALALTALALIAVLPEYAVDMVFAWQAAADPVKYGPLALANMTGANRLLIGVGWPLVVLLFWWRSRRAGRRVAGIVLDADQGVDLVFLGLATVYSFLIPIKGRLDLLDLVVLVTIFAVYAYRVAQAEHVEPELIGPAKLVGDLPAAWRRGVTIFFFAFSGVVIYLVAHEFAESLIATGDRLGIDERILVQWLAPLASEAPEFIITALFAWRLMAAASLGALVSSKVNQWTLLVGTLPLVFNIASASLGHPVPTGLPLDTTQRLDLLLTSAQSLFAVVIIANLEMSLREAALVFVLFAAQLVVSGFPAIADLTHIAFTAVYLVLALLLLVRNRSNVVGLVRSFHRTANAVH